MTKVGIVIVSHSPKIAEGTVDMVRQMVGTNVAVACAGGNPAGGLGTDVTAIMRAINAVWSDSGVAVFVDLGGAEMNADVAIQMFDEERRRRICVCNAPLVEGAVIAASEAMSGSTLKAVKRMAEELSTR
jgi:dihydroxyacetone kinase phosphotransfer subunit